MPRCLVLRLQFIEQRRNDARATTAKRMTQSQRTPVRIELLDIDAHDLDHRERLGRKSLVDLDDIDIAQLQPCSLECLVHGWHRTNAHDIGSHARNRHREDSSQWLDAQVARLLGRHQDGRRRRIIERAGVASSDRAIVLGEGGFQRRQFL